MNQLLIGILIGFAVGICLTAVVHLKQEIETIEEWAQYVKTTNEEWFKKLTLLNNSWYEYLKKINPDKEGKK